MHNKTRTKHKTLQTMNQQQQNHLFIRDSSQSHCWLKCIVLATNFHPRFKTQQLFSLHGGNCYFKVFNLPTF